MIAKITQSFIKSIRSYIAGEECGHIIRHQWIDDKLIESSDDMKLGSYFEYILGNLFMGEGKGALPKDKIVPEAKFYKKEQERYDDFKLKNKGQRLTMAESSMLKEYALAHVNARRVKDYFDKWGLKVISVGKRATKGRFEGTIDIIAKVTKSIKFDSGVVWKKGDMLCIDVKYSGLIDQQWKPFGWSWTDVQKAYHKIQATQYHYLTSLPFYYLVVSSTNDIDIRFFYIPISDDQVDLHIREGNIMMKEFNKAIEVGLIPRPSLSACLACPLFKTCEDKHEYPHPETIEV